MRKVNNIHLFSLGCAKNLVDSEVFLGGLQKAQFNILDKPLGADTLIVNTYGFLDSARKESVDVILDACRMKVAGDVEKVVVMGCFSARYPDELIKEISEVDVFFGTSDHAKIISFLTGEEHVKSDPDYFRSLLTPKHYAYLKIAEGCDKGCSFCSIPLMRGLQVSRSVEINVNEANRLVENGVKEILVIAQDTTTYGWDLEPKSSLDELAKIEKLEWIRLHSAHLHREMISRFASLEKLISSIDMPVQHGSTKLLKSMRRGLGKEGIKKRIDALRNVNPDIALRTSIIVGYPGKTETDFQELYDFVEDVQFDRSGVFTYSVEEGTHAAGSLEDNIPQQVKYDRMDAVMLAQQSISLEKNNALLESEQKVIIDNSLDNLSVGRTYRDSPEADNIIQIKG